MEATAKEFKNNINQKTNRALNKTEEIAENVFDKVEDLNLGDKYRALEKKTINSWISAREYWRENMAYSLAGAVAVGFLAGYLLRRKN